MVFGEGDSEAQNREEIMQQFKYPDIRRMFAPDPEHEFFDVDLDSADLRIVAWESDCKQHKQWLSEGKKVYVELMKEYYKDNTLTKQHKDYTAFKSITHGSHYLGTAAGVAAKVGKLVHEVDRVQKWYFGRCPEIKVWQDRIIKEINTRHYVQNAWGYRFYAFDRIDDSVYREAIAWVPQSSIGILINHGFVNIDKNLPEVKVLLQVHDSLCGEYPIDRAEHWRKRIVEECTVPVPYPEPLYIPVGLKCSPLSWGDCA
jgi:DNA polymerase I-like protein with 3'-5' exonuclease and polymerase domains